MGQPRVLVVDDDRATRDLLGDYFDAEGYAVRTAADGGEALGLLDAWHPDLIVLDLMMPGVDGWMFRVRQQAREEWAHIPVIALTAGDFPRDRIDQLRAAHLLRKPFDPDELLEAARAVAG